MRVRYWELKELVLEHYGDSCVECGETDPKELRIVFANKNMRHWRKKFGLVSTEAFYRFIYRNDFPDKYKIPGKYKLIILCKKHYEEFVASIPRSKEIRLKISCTMRAKQTKGGQKKWTKM
jgi:hypothetical protein